MSNTIKGTVATPRTVKGDISGVYGKDGLSAYEVAVKNGFKGTEQEWVNSLYIIEKTEGKTVILKDASLMPLRSLTANGTVIIEGKNICPGYVKGAYSNSNGEPMEMDSYFRTEKFLIPQDVKLVVSNGINQVINSIHYWDKDGNWLGRGMPNTLNNRPENAVYMGINFWTTTDIEWVQVEVGEATEYEPYKGKQTLAVGEDCSKVVVHSPITTIYGADCIVEYYVETKKYIDKLDLTKEVGTIQTPEGTIVSQNADFAEVAEWWDGNPNNEDRTGFFVCANVPLNGIVMKKAKSTDDVKGVTISAPAFAGNYTKDKLDGNGNLLPKYSYVAIIGFVPVRDNGTCTVGGRCMPDDNGCAVPSSNSMGYQVVNRIDENRVLIIIEPNGDMVQRIKTKVQSKIGFWQPNTEYKVGDVVIENFGNGYMGYPRTGVLRCVENHTSSDYFSQDYLGDLKWEQKKDVWAEHSYRDYLGNLIPEHYATKEELVTYSRMLQKVHYGTEFGTSDLDNIERYTLVMSEDKAALYNINDVYVNTDAKRSYVCIDKYDTGTSVYDQHMYAVEWEPINMADKAYATKEELAEAIGQALEGDY